MRTQHLNTLLDYNKWKMNNSKNFKMSKKNQKMKINKVKNNFQISKKRKKMKNLKISQNWSQLATF